MAQTRGATGNARPRVFTAIETTAANPRKTTTTRKPKTTTKPSVVGPKKKSPTGAGIQKSRAPNTHHKRKPSVKDKVEGALTKVVGKATGRPGKVGAGTKKIRGTDGKGARTAKK